MAKKIEDKWRILNVNTVQELTDNNPQMIRSKLNVVVQRIVFEVRGMSCLDFETIELQKNITSSRSFGKPTNKLEDLEEAIANYTAKAAIRLRKQEGRARNKYLYLRQ